VRAHVLAADEDPAEVTAEALAGCVDAIGVAGGDGSLGPVAGMAADHSIPFVVIPFGTRNHFARDLGLDPEDPVTALAAFEGTERAVDVGIVDGRTFLNNVSLGIYGSFVHDPSRKTRNRLLAGLRMAPAALGRSRSPLQLSFDVDARREEHAALVMLISNNAYRLESMSELGERETLDGGLLYAYPPFHASGRPSPRSGGDRRRARSARLAAGVRDQAARATGSASGFVLRTSRSPTRTPCRSASPAGSSITPFAPRQAAVRHAPSSGETFRTVRL
jgi:hypothetical protein